MRQNIRVELDPRQHYTLENNRCPQRKYIGLVGLQGFLLLPDDTFDARCQWIFEKQDCSIYTIMNANTGRYLCVPKRDQQRQWAVISTVANPDAGCLFRIAPCSNGFFTLQATCSGQYLHADYPVATANSDDHVGKPMSANPTIRQHSDARLVHSHWKIQKAVIPEGSFSTCMPFLAPQYAWTIVAKSTMRSMGLTVRGGKV